MAKNYTLSELRAMRKQREADIGWTDFAEVTLGATVNGGQYIGAGGTKVWVTVGGRTAMQVERGDANIPDVFGRPALIGKPPGRSYYQLFSVQGGGDERSGTVSHAEQHTVKQRWRQLPQLGDMVDPAFIGQHQITDLLIVPSSGYTFRVLPGIAVVNSTPVQLSASVEFTVDDTEIPAAIGEAVICRVELDSTGAVQLSYGSAYTEPVDDLTAIANAPAADPSRRTLGYIWMPEGMTAGNWWHAFPASLAERTGAQGVSDASAMSYTPDEPSDYPEGAPDDIAEALDLLAARTVGSTTPVYTKWDVDAPPVSAHASDDEFEGSVSGSWTDYDHGNRMTYAASSYSKGVRMVLDAVTPDLAGLLRSAPAGDFSATTCFSVSHQGSGGQRIIGILLAEGTGSTDNISLFCLIPVPANSDAAVQFKNYSAYATTGTTPFSHQLGGAGAMQKCYLRVRRISTTYYFDISFDGRAWTQVGTDSLSNLSSLTHIGIGGTANNASNGQVFVTFDFFRVSTNVDIDTPVHGQLVGMYAPP